MHRAYRRADSRRSAGFALLLALLATPVLAIKGDRLYSRGQHTAVHGAPSPAAPRVLVLDRGHLLVGIEADGAWIRVAVARTGGKTGWVRRQDLSTLKPIRLVAVPNPAFEQFLEELEAFNRGVLEQTGQRLFAKVEAVTPDMIHLTATTAWQALPARAMQRSLSRIATRWAQVNDSGNPTWVEIVDGDGAILMSEHRDR